MAFLRSYTNSLPDASTGVLSREETMSHHHTYYATSSHILCHNNRGPVKRRDYVTSSHITHTMSHHHTYYVTITGVLSREESKRGSQCERGGRERERERGSDKICQRERERESDKICHGRTGLMKHYQRFSSPVQPLQILSQPPQGPLFHAISSTKRLKSPLTCADHVHVC